MNEFSQDFGPLGSIWLNTADHGALPKVAVAALQEAVQWKISPHPLSTTDLFSRVPMQLKAILGQLINAPSEDIILGNSASYGLHLLANGIKFSPGDDILLVDGDFPCNILPWLYLKKHGVKIRVIKPKGAGLQPEEVLENIGIATKLLCTSWVFSYTGHIINLHAISSICREKGVKLVLNCSQALGTQPFDVTRGYADAITSVGCKWLCGPYGTGFSWIDPALREDLDYNQAYWLAMQAVDDLKNSKGMPEVKEDLGAKKYDVFGTANFFNFVPWRASVEYLLEKSIEKIKTHNDELIDHLKEGLLKSNYEILTPRNDSVASSILVISHKDKARNEEIFELLKQKNIYISLRQGNLRFALHLYNTMNEIDEALSMLNSV